MAVSAIRSRSMRVLALILAALVGLGGCVYDPYYGYAYDPAGTFVAGAIVGGVGTVVLTDPGFWPYRYGGYYHRYPYYRYPYGGHWGGRHYPYRPYYGGGHWHH
jgi:hypothetical protein